VNGTPVDKNVAKKYAQAFMTVFPKSCTFNDIKKIELAYNFLQTHKRTLFFLQLPQFDEERKKSMVADLIDYFSLPHDFAAIILLLIKHNRSFYIPDVLRWITQLYKDQIQNIEFSIKSAHDLTDKQVESIKLFLEHLVTKKIIGIPSVDTSLIAGLRLQSNDYLWEYSIRKQIKALQALKR
jgi:F-type H+-transporting ATPase subunit delta